MTIPADKLYQAVQSGKVDPTRLSEEHKRLLREYVSSQGTGNFVQESNTSSRQKEPPRSRHSFIETPSTALPIDENGFEVTPWLAKHPNLKKYFFDPWGRMVQAYKKTDVGKFHDRASQTAVDIMTATDSEELASTGNPIADAVASGIGVIGGFGMSPGGAGTSLGNAMYKAGKAGEYGAMKLLSSKAPKLVQRVVSPKLVQRVAPVAAKGAAGFGAYEGGVAVAQGEDIRGVARRTLEGMAAGAVLDPAIELAIVPFVKAAIGRLRNKFKGEVPTEAVERETAKDIGVDWDYMNDAQKAAIKRLVLKNQQGAVQSGRLLTTSAGQNFTFRDKRLSDNIGNIIVPEGKLKAISKQARIANEKLKETIEDVQNEFMTNELRANEMEYVKNQMGIDLDKLADDVIKAEDIKLLSDSNLKEIAEQARWKRIVGLEMPNLVRGKKKGKPEQPQLKPLEFKQTIEKPKVFDKDSFIGTTLKPEEIKKARENMTGVPMPIVPQQEVQQPLWSEVGEKLFGKKQQKPVKTTVSDSDISETYKAIEEDLAGVRAQPDKNISSMAAEVQGNSLPLRYNMTDIYRNLRNAFGRHYGYIKKAYLDPFDRSKGEFAKAVKAETKSLYDDVVKGLGIKKKSKESAATQWYGEGERMSEVLDAESGQMKKVAEEYTLEMLKKEFPKTWQNIVKADEWFRKHYDAYVDKINTTLKKIYPYVENEVAKLKQTQAEITKQREKVLRDTSLPKEAKNSAVDLLTEQADKISQKIDDVQLNRRLIKRKDYYRHFREIAEGLKGVENLLSSPGQIDPRLVGVSDVTSPLTRWASFMQRRLSGKYEADAVGGFLDYVKPANYKIHIEQHISRFRQLAKDLADNTVASKNANNLIEHLQMFANDLAGKTNPYDRPVQKTILGRKVMGIINWVNSRVMSNAVLGNLRSVLAQPANIPLGMSRLKAPKEMQLAAGQMIDSLTNPASPLKAAFEESAFLSERYMESAFTKFDSGILQRPKKFAAWMLRSADEVGTKWIWSTAYNKALKQGTENASKWADDFTRSIVAGRGVGEMPLAHKALMGRLVMPFQLEVGNMWHIFGDVLKEKDYASLALIPVALWVFNEGTRAVLGDDITFNPIGALIDAIKDDEATPAKVTGRLAGEVLSNVPLGQTMAGFIPENIRKEYFGRTDPTRFGTGGLNVVKPLVNAVTDLGYGNVEGAAQDIIGGYVMPWGGAQAKRTYQGLKSLNILPNPVDTTAETGRSKEGATIKFPVKPSLANALKAVAFGPYATEEGKQYSQSGSKPLDRNQTLAFKYAEEAGIDPQEMYRIILDMRQLKPEGDKKSVTDMQKTQVIMESTKLTPAQKGLLVNLFVKTQKRNKLIKPLLGE